MDVNTSGGNVNSNLSEPTVDSVKHEDRNQDELTDLSLKVTPDMCQEGTLSTVTLDYERDHENVNSVECNETIIPGTDSEWFLTMDQFEQVGDEDDKPMCGANEKTYREWTPAENMWSRVDLCKQVISAGYPNA